MKANLAFPLFVAMVAFAPSTAAAACVGSSTSDMTRCTLKDVESQNMAIAAAVAKTISMLKADPGTKGTTAVDLVRLSQQSWERYRESMCTAVGLGAAGASSSYQLIAAECMLDLGKERLRQLQALQRDLVQ